MELLESLAGYIGIAIQNAQLYRRLEQKMLDFERLNDFNENIVESINIGVFAVDLEDRIESWNAQMEVMYATPRAEALRRHLRDVFPPEFLQEFDRLRSEQGVSTLYKFRLPTPAGEARTANITIAPLLNRDFHAVGRIVLVDDITDRINWKPSSPRPKSSPPSACSPPVSRTRSTRRSPSSPATRRCSPSTCAATTASQARLQPVLEKITQQTFRASEIVNGLLNFSRMGSVDFACMDLNAMSATPCSAPRAPVALRQVSHLETDLDPNLPPIHGNHGKLQQVSSTSC